MSNCLSLLSEVFEAKKDPLNAAVSLISLIHLHPQLPFLWGKLASHLQLTGDLRLALYCQIRAKRLHQSVEKTVMGMALESNIKKQKNLQLSIESSQVNEVAELSELVEEDLFRKGKPEETVDDVDKSFSKLESKKPAEGPFLPSKEYKHPPTWINDKTECEKIIADLTTKLLKSQ